MSARRAGSLTTERAPRRGRRRFAPFRGGSRPDRPHGDPLPDPGVGAQARTLDENRTPRPADRARRFRVREGDGADIGRREARDRSQAAAGGGPAPDGRSSASAKRSAVSSRFSPRLGTRSPGQRLTVRFRAGAAEAPPARCGEPGDERPRRRISGGGRDPRRRGGPHGVRQAGTMDLSRGSPGSDGPAGPGPDCAR